MLDNDKISAAICIEQAKYLHKNIPAAVLGLVIGVIANSIIFWPYTPHTVLYWIAMTTPMFVVRMIYWWRMRQVVFNVSTAQKLITVNQWMASIITVMGGYGTLYILPAGSVTQQFIFICTIVFHNVASVFNLGAHYRSFLYGILPFALSVFAAIVTQKSAFNPAFAGVYLAFLLAVLFFAYRFNSLFIGSLRLRFENTALVNQLIEKKEAAEAALVIAELAGKAKSRFLAAASHDLRQPMHALDLYLGSLERATLPVEAQSLLQNAKQCAQAMNEMFSTLLDMSRLDADIVTPQFTVFSLASLLTHLQIQFSPLAEAKGIRFRVVQSKLKVKSDPALVERILRNLLENAIRYTTKGTILLGVRRRGNQVRVLVIDTGCGIAQEKWQTIFEEFYQVENPERDRTKGLGLGLAIVSRLARLLGTKVALISHVNKGSQFWLDLPVVDRQHQDVSRWANVGGRPTLPSSTNAANKLVLVIDDEELILEATRALLTHAGYSVIAAASLGEALDTVSDNNLLPDIILSDYRLEDNLTGIEAIQRIREEFNTDIPALLITGDTGPEAMQAFAKNDFVILHKPIAPDALIMQLQQLLARSPDHGSSV